jgi:DNA recombination protein RmuC
MSDLLLIATLALSALAALAAGLAVLRLARLGRSEPLDAQTAASLLRAETDILRVCGEDQARGLRQELGENLRGSVRDLGDQTNATLLLFGDRLEQSVAAIEKRVGVIAQKLDADIAGMAQEAARNREGLRQFVEAKLDLAAGRQSEQARTLRDELGASFQRLGGSVNQTLTELGDRQKERLEDHGRRLAALSETHAQSQEALRQTVENRLDRIREESANKLEEMRKTVDEKLRSALEQSLGEHVSRMFEQFNSINQTLGEMRNLAANVGDLRNVLTNVKVRGTFGEVQLGMLLEQFLAPEQYVRDARVRDNTLERVEYAIKYPSGDQEVLLPIDSKFPRETYERLLEASDAGDGALIEAHRRQLQAQIKACAKEISDKYIHPPRTTDHAILFLPTEGLFAEVLRLPGVMECIHRDHRVTLAGPTTLAATLSAFQMGFRSLAIERRSGEVRQMLSAVQNEFGRYNKVVEDLDKQLNTALNSVGKLGTRTRAMTRRLKGVEALPEGVSSAELLGLEADELAVGEDPPPTSSKVLLPLDEA